MKSIIKKSILVLCCLILANAIAQQTSKDVEVLFKRSSTYYKKQTSFKASVSYDLYKTYDGNEVVESYKGELLSDGASSYSKVMNTEQLQSNNHYVKVNHDEKALFYGKAETSNTSAVDLSEIQNLLSYFKSYSIKNKGNQIICDLIAPDITQLPYSRVTIYFNKDYSMTKQVLYLATVYPYRDEKTGKDEFHSPRFEISLSALKGLPKEEEYKLKLSNYMQLGTPISLSKSLTNYQLILAN